MIERIMPTPILRRQRQRRRWTTTIASEITIRGQSYRRVQRIAGDTITTTGKLASAVQSPSGQPVHMLRAAREERVIVNPEVCYVAEVKDTHRARQQFARVCAAMGIEAIKTESGSLDTSGGLIRTWQTCFLLTGERAADLHSGAHWRVYRTEAFPDPTFGGHIGPAKRPARSHKGKGKSSPETPALPAPCPDCTVIAPLPESQPVHGPILPALQADRLAVILDASWQSQGSGI